MRTLLDENDITDVISEPENLTRYDYMVVKGEDDLTLPSRDYSTEFQQIVNSHEMSELKPVDDCVADFRTKTKLQSDVISNLCIMPRKYINSWKMLLFVIVVLFFSCSKDEIPDSEESIIDTETIFINYFYVNSIEETGCQSCTYKITLSNGADFFYLYDRNTQLGLKKGDKLMLVKE